MLCGWTQPFSAGWPYRGQWAVFGRVGSVAGWSRRGGTTDAFAEWVAPHVSAMHQLAVRLCGRADGEDVVQDSLVRAWRRWETFRPERGSPRVWLLAIVANQACQRRRRRKPVVLGEPRSFRSSLTSISNGRSLVSRAVSGSWWSSLLRGTGGERRRAEVMGCAEGTVKSTLADVVGGDCVNGWGTRERRRPRSASRHLRGAVAPGGASVHE